MENNDNGTSTARKGLDALFLSASSPDIASSAASLMRQVGLASSGTNEEGEFCFRFHWMRPHPGLAFSLEDEIQRRNIPSFQAENDPRRSGGPNNDLHPAVEMSRLIEAHWNAQLAKSTSSCTHKVNIESHDSDRNAISNGRKGKASDYSPVPSTHAIEATTFETPRVDLPLKLPKLRINLANLIEPPMMSAWLPQEDLSDTDHE